MKKIPKTLRAGIVRAIYRGNEALPSSAIADRLNSDPKVPTSMMKTPKQIAYLMNNLARQYPDLIEVEVVSQNGTSHHGNERYRKAWDINREITLAEAEKVVGVLEEPKRKRNKKQITVMLPPDCVDYIKAWKETHSMSAGDIVEQLIRADMNANGLPNSE